MRLRMLVARVGILWIPYGRPFSVGALGVFVAMARVGVRRCFGFGAPMVDTNRRPGGVGRSGRQPEDRRNEGGPPLT